MIEENGVASDGEEAKTIELEPLKRNTYGGDGHGLYSKRIGHQ